MGLHAAVVDGGSLRPGDARRSSRSRRRFLQGKEIRLIIGQPPGGGYDTFARLFARHLGRLMPGNPSVIPQNMPGAAAWP